MTSPQIGETAVPPPRSLGIGAGLATVSQLVAAVASGLTGVLVARLLGATETGQFSLMVTLVIVLSVLCPLGLDYAIAYNVAGRRWRPGDTLPQVQIAALVLGAAGAVLAAGVAVVARDSLFGGVPSLAIVVTLTALPFAISWLLSGAVALATDRYEVYAAGPAAQTVLGLVLVAVLGPVAGLDGAVAALAIAHVVVAALIFVVLRRQLGHATRGWGRRTTATVTAGIRYGVTPAATALMGLLNQRADLFILNAYDPGPAVGAYAIALSLTALQLIVPGALAHVVMPRVAASEDAGDEQATIASSVRHAVLLALAAAVVVALALPAVPLVYGPGFEDTVELGWILVPGVAAHSVATVLVATVLGKGQTRYPLIAALAVTPATLVMYLYAVPRWGATGAAVASTISYAASAALHLYFFRKVTGLRNIRELLPGRADFSDYAALAGRIRVHFRRGGSR